MVTLPGYRFGEQIYLGTRTQVYRGFRDSDSLPVVIKLPLSEYPSFAEILQIRNQYAIGKNLEDPGIVRPIALERYRNGFALVMEDFGGISLKEYTASRTLSLAEFFKIALSLVKTLEALIRNRVIHKDIKPQNILINPQTEKIKLIDFSISSLLPRENQPFQNPSALEGTLAYMSPEQTGRMNRGIDYRTDFYSLGVTFYELLTGQLPFQSDDPMELVHCHIAKNPAPAIARNPAIPQAVNDILIKLMAKNPEDRYQSCLGLRSDLESCWQQWENSGRITPFPLGKRDISDRFVIPEKLYGREAEVSSLLAAFERARAGTPELMLVAGFSGIGKTAVVREVHKPIVESRGYFISGKFDQLGRNIPFSALVQALRELMQQLLFESGEKLAEWQAQILEALGEDAQVLIEVIPELEQITGKQPPAAELSPFAAQNRFNLLFGKFIRVFARSDRPLVIFLDDLQWADIASLKLMQLLANPAESQYLLFVGAYRDNEVSPAHPLMLTLEEIRASGATVSQIFLAPLDRQPLNSLIADTLNCAPERALPLTELVWQKTQGNPFFTNQFLKYLHEQELISFDSDSGYWQCDIAKVRALAVADDVVEFVTLQLQQLPDCAREILKLAACIGNQFDLATLALVSEKSQAETAAYLWKSLQEGLVLPVSEVYKFYQNEGELNEAHLDFVNKPVEEKQARVEIPDMPKNSLGECFASTKERCSPAAATYKFLHDRVQQSAYFLIPEDQKQSTHLKIGRRILNHTPAENREEKIFEIVNHLNIGLPLISDCTETEELAQLNLTAGRKARASTACAAALGYFTAGINLLGADSWQSHYHLSLSLYEEATEAAYLCGDFERMDQFASAVLNCAKTLVEKVKVYEVKIQAHIAQNQLLEAIQTALAILKLLGIEFPDAPNQSYLQQVLAETASHLSGKQLDDLINWPPMTDPEKLAAMRLLARVASAAYIGLPELYAPIVLQQVNLSIEYGNTAISAYAYATYGLILCGVVGDIDGGYRSGELALRLLEKFDAKEFKAKIFNLVYPFVWVWKRHVRDVLPALLEGYHSGLETGDLEFAAYCAYNYCALDYSAGNELGEVEKDMATYSLAIRLLKQETALNFHEIFRQAALNLRTGSEEPWRLIGEAYDERVMLPKHKAANDQYAIASLYLNKMVLSYLFDSIEVAWQNTADGEPYKNALGGSLHFATFCFYDSLIQLAAHPCRSESEKQEILEKVSQNQEKMQQWAHQAPMNFAHKFYLVEAERYRVLGDSLKAMDLYDRAIFLAQENDYIQEEAIACERAAKFYLAWGKEIIAEAYLKKAYYGFARWGSIAKMNDLEKRYPQLLEAVLVREKNSFISSATISQMTLSTSASTTTGAAAMLDMSSVIKASQALSGEIILNQLLSILMQVVMENAGASKGALILLEDDRLTSAALCFDSRECDLHSVALDSNSQVPVTLLNYVARSQETLLLDNVKAQTTFAADPYLQRHQPKSVLCMPLVNQGKPIGILYLENNLTAGAFTRDRLQVLNVLTAQAAISIENARLYQKSQEDTQKLEKSLYELQQAQLQLIQKEKMSALGKLVAGVAHEINNPVGFIAGNLAYASEYVQNLIAHLHLYQQQFPHPGAEISAHAGEIELDYLVSDLPTLISSMKEGTDRIRNISRSLRIFSRSDTSEKVAFNIHDGLDSTLLILKYKLKANKKRPEIEIVKDYGNLPAITGYPGQLNQVFVNILANAIDALEGDGEWAKAHGKENQCPTIWIRTEILPDENRAIIRIKDNGPGMPKEVKERIFEQLYTTKPAGKGTGLGLSISRQIVEEKHGGRLTCISEVGEGTEFAIALPI